MFCISPQFKSFGKKLSTEHTYRKIRESSLISRWDSMLFYNDSLLDLGFAYCLLDLLVNKWRWYYPLLSVLGVHICQLLRCSIAASAKFSFLSPPTSFFVLPPLVCVFSFLNFIQKWCLWDGSTVRVFCVIPCVILTGWFVDVGHSISIAPKSWLPKRHIGHWWTCITVRSRTTVVDWPLQIWPRFSHQCQRSFERA